MSSSLTAGMLDAAKNSPELVKSIGSPSESPQAYLEKGRTHGDRTAQLCGFGCFIGIYQFMYGKASIMQSVDTHFLNFSYPVSKTILISALEYTLSHAGNRLQTN